MLTCQVCRNVKYQADWGILQGEYICGPCAIKEIERLQCRLAGFEAEIEDLRGHNDGLTGEHKIECGLMWELDGTTKHLIVIKLAGEDRLRAVIGTRCENKTVEAKEEK